ncbi:hypothetical protein [Pantoea sp. App145]
MISRQSFIKQARGQVMICPQCKALFIDKK